MKFHINKIRIWQEDNKIVNTIEFEPNKINVVTGDGFTGKTTILKIIDYCLFAKENDIPFDDINSKIFFYGINITINDKTITICRKAFDKDNNYSNIYLFYEDGTLPKEISYDFNNLKIKESVIKKFLEKEFDINENIKLLPKGRSIEARINLKLQYFLLFNFISQELINSEQNFFDFEINNRDTDLYKFILNSIFDLSIGLSTKNIFKIFTDRKENYNKLEKTKKSKEKQNKKLRENEDFVKKIINKAKGHNLIDDEIDTDNIEEAFSILRFRIKQEFSELKKSETNKSKYKELEGDERKLKYDKKRLESFKRKIQEYQDLISEEEDALKPFEYISQNYNNLISVTEVKDFLDNVKDELINVRKTIKSTLPVQYNIDEEVNNIQSNLKKVKEELKKHPKTIEFLSLKDRFEFLVRADEQIKAFLEKKGNNKFEIINFDEDIEFYQSEIKKLTDQLPQNLTEQRAEKIKLLNDLIQDYLTNVKKSLGKYTDHIPSFNYTEKTLELQKPSNKISSKMYGSSSTPFFQISLFLGLHELFITQNNVKFIPQFIIIDYPSLPYKSQNIKNADDDIDSNDRAKLRNLFELLNSFIDKVNNDYNTEFQIIILEHIQSDIWREPTILNNFYLSKEYRNGNNLLNS